MNNKGSILILTMIAVLVLSIMVTGLLTVGTTEQYSTQNYHMSKIAYYTAVQGIEEIRNSIYNAPDAQAVTAINKSLSSTQAIEFGLKKSYITGTMEDLETSSGAGVPIKQFLGFEAPQMQGISLGGAASIASLVWKVSVTSNIQSGSRGQAKNAYSEITVGVYSVAVVGY